MRLSLFGNDAPAGGQHAGIAPALPALPRYLRAGLLLPLACLLAACASGGDAPTDAGGDSAGNQPERAVLNPPATESSTAADGPGAPLPAGVAELLEQASWALQAGRLTHPPKFNARDYYQQVLDLQPSNREARAGLQNVLDRSIELGLDAARDGNFKRAELLLTRAERFALNDPGIRGAREYVHRLSRQGRRSYPLPATAVRARDAAALATSMKKIARQAVENRATVEILTADDLQGLWLFDQLRLHAGDEPLRATIHDAQEPEIRLTWRR